MITSKENGKIKEIAHLMRSSSYRRETGMYVAEGRNMVSEAPPELIEEVFMSESFVNWNEFCVGRLSDDIGFEYEIVSDKVFARLSDLKSPQGIIAVMRMPGETDTGAVFKDPDLVVVLDGLSDPGNAGTIIRTAEACGVSGIIMTGGSVDIYNPKVVRSTMGSIYRVPVLYMKDMAEIADLLKGAGLKVYATMPPGGDNDNVKNLFDMDLCGKEAFIIGNESNGVSRAAKELADGGIYIPMMGKGESLNAAIACGIIMYFSRFGK